MNRTIILAIIGFSLFLLGAYRFFTVYIPSLNISPVRISPTPVQTRIETSKGTYNQTALTGELVCLTPKGATGKDDEVCTHGIKADDGYTYALSINQSLFQAGKQVTVKGLVVPVEALSSLHWQNYSIRGVMQVETVLE